MARSEVMAYNLMDRLRKHEWTVRPVSLITAQQMVIKHHYAGGGSNTGTYVHGLFLDQDFMDADCCGVARWLPPTKGAATFAYPDNWQGVLALSRLVILPGIPKNAASFLLSRSMKLIDRDRWPCLLTYADTWRGHTGAIYKATNWQYHGETVPLPIYVKNGRMISRKAGGHTRTHQDMLNMGAVRVGTFSKHRFIHITGKG